MAGFGYVGQKVRALRKWKGISQEELAFRVGVERQSVSLWECNDVRPKIWNLLTLSEELEISLEDLLYADLIWRADASMTAEIGFPAENGEVPGVGEAFSDAEAGPFSCEEETSVSWESADGSVPTRAERRALKRKWRWERSPVRPLAVWTAILAFFAVAFSVASSVTYRLAEAGALRRPVSGNVYFEFPYAALFACGALFSGIFCLIVAGWLVWALWTRRKKKKDEE